MHYIKDQMMVEFSSTLCGDFAALVFRNVLRFCELESNSESVESKITLMDIRKSRVIFLGIERLRLKNKTHQKNAYQLNPKKVLRRS